MTLHNEEKRKRLTLPSLYGNLHANLKNPTTRTRSVFDQYKDYRSYPARDNISLASRELLSLPEISALNHSKMMRREGTFTKPRSRQSHHSFRSMRSFRRSTFDEEEPDFTKRLSENRVKHLLGELYTDKQYLEYIARTTEGRGIDAEVLKKSKKGLEYLKSRCLFWENQTPIPLRPDPFLIEQMYGGRSRLPSRRRSITRENPMPKSPVTQVRIDALKDVRGKTFHH
ncbi:hypothetical protein FSP39_009860 [Pinctada imbricata]|uniref:Uncharacterized protein n=1 Tax=Pinctada imbricata TaxID=66713 RepID=A0AA88XFN1_PINIB|nr:hypothetical protein FSP39_009860 [Pinctada imbricata]